MLATVILVLAARLAVRSAPTDSAARLRPAIIHVPALSLEAAAAQVVIVERLRTIAQRRAVKPPTLTLVRLRRHSHDGVSRIGY